MIELKNSSRWTFKIKEKYSYPMIHKTWEKTLVALSETLSWSRRRQEETQDKII